MSQFICPTCGKFVSTRYYDPTNFRDDILLVQVRGLGRGKGVEIVEKYSLLDGSDPELLDLISDRVAVLYDLLYEDVKDDEDEADHSVDHEDEEEEEKVDFESLSELDKQIFLAEQEEEDEEEDEDINDLDEKIIE